MRCFEGIAEDPLGELLAESEHLLTAPLEGHSGTLAQASVRTYNGSDNAGDASPRLTGASGVSGLVSQSDSIFLPLGATTSQPAPNWVEPSPVVCPALESAT